MFHARKMAVFRRLSLELEGNASNEDSQVTDKYNSDSEEEEYARTREDSRPDTMPHLSEEEDSDKENESIGKVKKKVGRKNQWEEEVVDDLFDIILENEDYKRKLLLTNTKKGRNAECLKAVLIELKNRCNARGYTLPYDIVQTKTKIKRCQKICRLAAMTVKTASGIKRFQEEKSLGNWFNKLLPIVMSAPNCQPDQAIEPSQITGTPRPTGGSFDENNDDESREDFRIIADDACRKMTFVPLKRSSSTKNKELGCTNK